jgi:ubiquitin-activating enzyme E1
LQYFFREEDVGRSRAEVTAPRLAELNSYVPIHVHADELTAEELQKYSVVVATECATEELVRLDDICHAHGLCFIAAQTYGLFGQIFCDFGPAFVVNDINGETPISVMVASITEVCASFFFSFFFRFFFFCNTI